MPADIARRLARPEAAAAPASRQVYVWGSTDKECDATVADLKSRGEATEADQFVCFRWLPPTEPSTTIIQGAKT